MLERLSFMLQKGRLIAFNEYWNKMQKKIEKNNQLPEIKYVEEILRNQTQIVI